MLSEKPAKTLREKLFVLFSLSLEKEHKKLQSINIQDIEFPCLDYKSFFSRIPQVNNPPVYFDRVNQLYLERLKEKSAKVPQVQQDSAPRISNEISIEPLQQKLESKEPREESFKDSMQNVNRIIEIENDIRTTKEGLPKSFDNISNKNKKERDEIETRLLEFSNQSFDGECKQSLHLEIFQNDFSKICEYCHDPDKFELENEGLAVNEYSQYVLKMIAKYRLNILRKEQKIKKVLNMVFKIMIKKFAQEYFPNITHVSESIKREFSDHYFLNFNKCYSKCDKAGYDKKYGPRSKNLNLGYNNLFFANVKRSPSFLKEMRIALKEIEDMIVPTINMDVRRILKRIEICSFSNSSKKVDCQEIEKYFLTKNQDGNRMGIKIPWTQKQMMESIDLVTFIIDADFKTFRKNSSQN